MRRRLVTAIAAVTAGALLLFGLPLALAVTRIYRDEELIRVQRVATTATQAIGPSITTADPPELPTDATTRLSLYGRSGARQDGTGPTFADAAVRAALAGRVGSSTAGGRLVVAIPIARSEQVIGVIRAERSGNVVRSRALRTWLLMAVLAAVVLAVATAVAVLVARRVTAPVEALADAMRRLGDGDFAARATPSGVAELDDAGAALHRTATRLGDLLDRERQFSANASHQLRTPLTALRLDLEAGRPEHALAQVDRLEATIQTLIAAARDAPRSATSTDLEPIEREVTETWTGLLASKGRKLRVTSEPGVPGVAVDAAVIHQILQVLIENAVRHGQGQVNVAFRRASSGAAIDVTDQGPGITTNTEDPFVRRNPAATGSGIGLSIARSLATADGARLVLQRPGPHPTFTLLLPAANADE